LAEYAPRLSFADQYADYTKEFWEFTKEELTAEHCISSQEGREKMASLIAAACSYSGKNLTTDALYNKAVVLFKVFSLLTNL
jgi:hypothetical protein